MRPKQMTATLAGLFVLVTLGAGLCFGLTGTSRPDDAAASPAARTPARGKPRWIHRMWIPFGPKRRHQMASYSKRHYGKREWRLRHPRQIVEHIAVGPSVGGIWNTFASNHPDPELGELPNVCAHFAVSSTGRVYQLVSLRNRCRHTVGLNHVAIGIEHVGYSDGDLLGNRRELRGSIRLTKWLRCHYGIRIRDVIGHNESLRSRFHRERVKHLRHQTHGDMRHSSMSRYRHRLYRAGLCPMPEPGSGRR